MFLFYIGLKKGDAIKTAGDVKKSVQWKKRQKNLCENRQEEFVEMKKQLIEEKLDRFRDLKDLHKAFGETRYLVEKDKIETESKELIHI